MSRDLVSAKNLSLLVKWCEKRGLTVLFAKHENGTYDECTKTITIAANALPEKQVFYLIHECGHHLINANLSRNIISRSTIVASQHHHLDTQAMQIANCHAGTILNRISDKE